MVRSVVDKKANVGRTIMNSHEKGVVSEAQMRKAVARAFRKVMDSAKREPSVVVISDSSDGEIGCPVEEIRAWLFQRGRNNGSTRN
jgi:hypothetical protein